MGKPSVRGRVAMGAAWGLGIALLAWLVDLEKDRAEGESRFALEDSLALKRWDEDWMHHTEKHGWE